MKQMIGFVGYECEEIILFLADCMVAYGKKVAIEDRTEHGMLLQILEFHQRVSKDMTAMEYHKIRISTTSVIREEFDFVFQVFGYRLQHPKLYECEALIMVTDMLPAHAAILKDIGLWDRRQSLLIRNYIETKHGQEYLQVLSNQRFDHVYCIPWEERDMRIRYCLGTEEVYDLSKLSLGMKETLREMLRFLMPGISEDFLRRIGKKGRRGIAGWEN